MKKLLFLLVFVLTSLFLNANVQKENDYGFSTGDLSLEVNFNPLNISVINYYYWGTIASEEDVRNTIELDYIRARYFFSDDMALRFGFQFNIDSELEEDAGWYDTSLRNRVVDFGFYPGIEKHFRISDRVSSYFGGEFGYFTRTTRSKPESNIDVEIKNEDGYTSIRLNLLAGVDIHIYKGFYMGLELGYGFQRKSFKDTRITRGTSTDIEEDDDVVFRLGDIVNSSIRLGFAF